MSFKASLFFTLTFSLLSCGKKGPPRAPKDSLLPSYEVQYIKEKSKKNNASKEN